MDITQNSPYGPVRLNAAKYYFTINKELLRHNFGYRNIHQKWHHFCFSIEYNQLDYDKRESIMNLYHNGKVVQKGTHIISFIHTTYLYTKSVYFYFHFYFFF